MIVERCNVTKVNNDRKYILYYVLLIKLTKLLNSLNTIAFSLLKLLNSKICGHKVPIILKLSWAGLHG